MSSVRKLGLMGAVALCAPVLATAEGITIPKGSSGPPTYTNAQVVAVDVIGRSGAARPEMLEQ
jgi:hypothetical protein